MNYLADSVTTASQTVQANSKILLQPGDRIGIIVTALNPAAAQAFNIGGGSASGSSLVAGTSDISGTASNPQMPGYLINEEGTIQFPQLGKLPVKGMTTQNVEDTIQKALLQFLKEPIVHVDIINFKVNVIGEVNRPGTISVPDGKITILEAISRSGDLTINGMRDNILIVREKEGKREFGKVNLASNSIFSSPYFYLQQGDVVYVNMNKNKLLLSDANEQRNFRIASIMLAGVSAIALIINTIRR